MNKAQEEIRRLKAIIDNLQATLTKKDAAHKSFSTQSNELLASMQKQIHDMSKVMQQQQEIVVSLQNDKITAHQSNMTLRIAIVDLQNKNDALSSAAAEKDRNIDDLQAQIADLQDKLSRRDTDHRSFAIQSDKALADMREQMDAMNKVMQQQQEIISSLHRERTIIEQPNKIFQATVADLRDENVTLKSTLAEKDHNIHDLRTKIADLENELSRRDTDHSSFSTKSDKTLADIREQMNAMNKVMQQQQEMLKSQQREKDEKDRSIHNLQHINTELRNSLSEMQDNIYTLEDRLEDITRKLKDKTEELERICKLDNDLDELWDESFQNIS